MFENALPRKLIFLQLHGWDWANCAAGLISFSRKGEWLYHLSRQPTFWPPLWPPSLTSSFLPWLNSPNAWSILLAVNTQKVINELNKKLGLCVFERRREIFFPYWLKTNISSVNQILKASRNVKMSMKIFNLQGRILYIRKMNEKSIKYIGNFIY